MGIFTHKRKKVKIDKGNKENTHYNIFYSYIYFVINLILFVSLLVLIYVVCRKSKSLEVQHDHLKIDFNKQHFKFKEDCDHDIKYCFEDNDCTEKCITKLGTNYICKVGMCINQETHTLSPENACSSKAGVIAFLTSDADLGTNTFICKSIDPGIASNNPAEPNLMCIGGQISIDYRRRLPETSDCVCDHSPYIVPPTHEVRRRVLCVNSEVDKFLSII